MLRLGWMSTARGEGSMALLRFVCEHIEAGELDATISIVVSDREPGELVAVIDSFGMLSVAIVNGSAAETLGAGVGEQVHLIED